MGEDPKSQQINPDLSAVHCGREKENTHKDTTLCLESWRQQLPEEAVRTHKDLDGKLGHVGKSSNEKIRKSY